MLAPGIFTPRSIGTMIFCNKAVFCWLRAADPEGIPVQETELCKSRYDLRSGSGMRLSRLRTAGRLCTWTFIKKKARYLNVLLQDSRLHLSPV